MDMPSCAHINNIMPNTPNCENIIILVFIPNHSLIGPAEIAPNSPPMFIADTNREYVFIVIRPVVRTVAKGRGAPPDPFREPLHRTPAK